jgi:single-strand DNA-binding protein
MSSVNKVILVGNVGRDPEVRLTQNGTKIGNLSIATSESWKDKSSGERKEKTEWHRVVIFDDQLVGIVEKWVKKGDKLYLEGSLQTRKWEDKEGNEKYTTEIVLQRFTSKLVMLSGKSGGGSKNKDENPAFYTNDDAGDRDSGELNDEIPW